MNISIDKKDLLRALARVKCIVDKKSTLHRLSDVLIEAESSRRIRVSGTNLYMTVSCVVEADVDRDRVDSIAVSVCDMFDRVKSMKDGLVYLRAASFDKLIVASEGSARRYTIPSQDGTSFPCLPSCGEDSDQIRLAACDLLWLINRTGYAISDDDSHSTIGNALFEWDRGLVRMVGAGRHMMAVARLEEGKVDGRASMLIPKVAVKNLQKLVEEFAETVDESGNRAVFTIAKSEGSAFFTIGDICFSAKLKDGAFPAYQQALDHEGYVPVSVKNRKALIDTVNAVSLAASERLGRVKLELCNENLAMSAESSEHGNGYDEVESKYKCKSLTVGVNARYLHEILRSMDDSEGVVLSFDESDPLAAIRVESDKELEGRSCVTIVMPYSL